MKETFIVWTPCIIIIHLVCDDGITVFTHYDGLKFSVWHEQFSPPFILFASHRLHRYRRHCHHEVNTKRARST